MSENKDLNLEITKDFMAQADNDTRFYGTIKSGSNSDGIPVIPDRIKVLEGFIMA